jgi:hypothetical protein
MARVADIIVVQDGKARLAKGRPISMGLSISKNIDRESHSVLTFMVDSIGEPDGFKFRVELVSVGPGALRRLTTMRIITACGKSCHAGAYPFSVQHQFAYDGGDGEIDISDIVI